MSSLEDEYNSLEQRILHLALGGGTSEYPETIKALNTHLQNVRHKGIDDALTEAREVISQYVVTSEKWRYDRVMWAFAIMLGEIPEDTPMPGPSGTWTDRVRGLTP